MNTYRYILAVLLLISQLTGCGNLKENKYDENTPITTFMLGKWRATRQTSDIYGSYQEDNFVKFMKNGKMMYCHREPIEPFCTDFSYRYLGEGLLAIENNRITEGEWVISRKGDDLQICIWNSINCFNFLRDNSGFNILLEVFKVYR